MGTRLTCRGCRHWELSNEFVDRKHPGLQYGYCQFMSNGQNPPIVVAYTNGGFAMADDYMTREDYACPLAYAVNCKPPVVLSDTRAHNYASA